MCYKYIYQLQYYWKVIRGQREKRKKRDERKEIAGKRGRARKIFLWWFCSDFMLVFCFPSSRKSLVLVLNSHPSSFLHHRMDVLMTPFLLFVVFLFFIAGGFIRWGMTLMNLLESTPVRRHLESFLLVIRWLPLPLGVDRLSSMVPPPSAAVLMDRNFLMVLLRA